MVYYEENIIKECADFLLKQNRIEKKDIHNIKKIYYIIERTDYKMFSKLKKELRKKDWIT